MNGVDHLPTKAERPKLKLYHFDKHRKLAFFESYIQAVCISKGEENWVASTTLLMPRESRRPITSSTRSLKFAFSGSDGWSDSP